MVILKLYEDETAVLRLVNCGRVHDDVSDALGEFLHLDENLLLLPRLGDSPDEEPAGARGDLLVRDSSATSRG